jgi:hypothetical protein
MAKGQGRKPDLEKDRLAFELVENEGMSWNQALIAMQNAGYTIGRSTVRDAYAREKARRKASHNKRAKKV